MTSSDNPKTKNSYDESAIQALKGLEPVRRRPGMYTRTESPNHIIQEVVDNAQDEALAGFATAIDVVLHEDGSIETTDNGRGIPVGIHPTEGIPTVVVVLTSLHAGGKFHAGDENNPYTFSGGLHGVGVSVTNALSTRLEATVWRDGKEHVAIFENGNLKGKVSSTPLPKGEKRRTGTRIRAWPDPKYFDAPFQAKEFARYLRSKAVLLPQAKVSWTVPGKETQVWHFPGGLPEYLQQQTGDGADWIAPPCTIRKFYEQPHGAFLTGEGFEVALGWGQEGSPRVRESYVNLIHTQGGRHETGLRAGLLEAFRLASDRRGLTPKGVRLESDDVMGQLSFVLSAKITDPRFAGQTKDRMTSEKAHKLIAPLVRDAMELWFTDHREDSEKLLRMAVDNAVRRARNSKKVARKKPMGVSLLPGKLSDCESKDMERTELFLVEGDSAGGSSKDGRDRVTQAILPLRGKLLNTWETDPESAKASDTIHDIVVSLGVEPHPGRHADEVDLSSLRYGKVLIMADADVDGQHIQVLLLTLFLRHFPALLERGHIWVARAPLFRIDAPPKKGGKVKRAPRKLYALDEEERDAMVKELLKEGVAEDKIKVGRFKGLGEMNPEQLKETTMDPDNRRAIQVVLEDAEAAAKAFDRMMSKKASEDRRQWMETEGYLVDEEE